VFETEEIVADLEPNRTFVALWSVPKPVPIISTAVPAGPEDTLKEDITGVAASE